MSARLTVLALAILIVGAVYSTVNDANAVDARTVLVCPTPTPHPTPAGRPTETPIPTTGLSRPIPAFPMVYFGDATVGGNPVPDCTGIYAKVEEFESGRVIVVDGKYAGLALGAPDASYNKAVITFHLADALVADQTDTYVYTQAPSISMIKQGFNLNFPHLVTPEPTITPLAFVHPDPDPYTHEHRGAGQYTYSGGSGPCGLFRPVGSRRWCCSFGSSVNRSRRFL